LLTENLGFSAKKDKIEFFAEIYAVLPGLDYFVIRREGIRGSGKGAFNYRNKALLKTVRKEIKNC
jgi:hypothetical protein